MNNKEMSYEQAINKYPSLTLMAILDLTILRHDSIGVDEDFRQAIDAVMKHIQENN